MVHRVDRVEPPDLQLLKERAQASYQRLTSALRLERYFHQLSNQYPSSEVSEQWEHSRRLMRRAIGTYESGASPFSEAARTASCVIQTGTNQFLHDEDVPDPTQGAGQDVGKDCRQWQCRAQRHV